MATKTPSGKTTTSKSPVANRPSGRISPNVTQHSLKPTGPGSRPTIKPGPGPKTK